MTLAETVAHAGDEVDGCDGSTDVAALQATDALLNGLIRFVQTTCSPTSHYLLLRHLHRSLFFSHAVDQLPLCWGGDGVWHY